MLDVLNKYVVPHRLLTSPVFWFFNAFFNPLAALKLGGRYKRNGCIRNHTNHTHRPHNCKRTTRKLHIYFGASVAGGRSENVARFVKLLRKIGIVQTDNLAARNPDEPGKTPEEIHYTDMRKLAQSDVVIADMSNPSSGTGFMLGHAVHLGKPVLCLFSEGSPVSAMLAGSHSMTVKKYSNFAEAAKHIRTFVTEHRDRYPTVQFDSTSVVIVGPPGAGKTTLGLDLASRFPFPSISTGQLLRDSPSPRITELMNKGERIPAREMMQILDQRLKKGDAALFGYVVDGYPSSMENLQAFKEIRGSPDIVIYLDASQEVCAERIVGRAARPSDNAAVAQSRRKGFDMDPESVRAAFSDSEFLFLDTSQSANPQEVADKIAAFVEARTGGTSRFHVHVDGPNIDHLRAFASQIEYELPDLYGRFELTRVPDLRLGPQVKEMPESYNDMPNFHTIVNATYEGFLTIDLGERFDPVVMRAILSHVRASRKEYNIELEEYVHKDRIEKSGENVMRREYKITPGMKDELRKLRAFEKWRAKKIPELELHLGFDLPTSDPRLELEEFVQKVSDKGLRNGGWFRFEDPAGAAWQYRSNQLMNSAPIPTALALLQEHGRSVQNLLATQVGRQVVVNTSLEIIHGIWKFDKSSK